jgi:hypothetical protein
MADHIADLLIDHKVAGTIGRAARQRAESEFGATRLANAMADEYERVLSGGTPAAPQGSASRNVSSSESFELS